jgi:glycosyltransferase involved in cell wall biosynthesis
MQNLNIFSLEQINYFLKKNKIEVLGPATETLSKALDNLRYTQRMVLSLWLDEKNRQASNWAPLSLGNPEFVYSWLISQGLSKHKQLFLNIQRVFSRSPGCLVRKFFDHHLSLKEALPCGLSIPYWNILANWLFTQNLSSYRMIPEDIIWFLFESSEDPSMGLVDTWLRNADWQTRWPNAFQHDYYNFFLEDLVKYDPHFFSFIKYIRLNNKELNDHPKINSFLTRTKSNRGINIVGHFCYPSGLGEAANQMNHAISLAGGEASLRDFPSSYNADLATRDHYLGIENWPVTAFVMSPEHDLDIVFRNCGLKRTAMKKHVGVWYWELEDFPEKWGYRANQFEEIWAPSAFIANSIRRKSEVPVVHLPPGVELRPFEKKTRSFFGLPENDFLFLNVFDMCSVFERKNPLAIIEAFSMAFPNGGPKLVIKVNRGEFNPAGLKALELAIQNIGGLVINSTYTREETYALMNLCDSYISLHRSEGFGLTLAEAMLMGKPVIATNYSGNLDFMDTKSSCLIPYQLTLLEKQYHVYQKGNVWAEPFVELAAQAMRWVCSQPKYSRQMARLGKERAEKVLNLKAAGERFLERARYLQDQNSQVRERL